MKAVYGFIGYLEARAGRLILGTAIALVATLGGCTQSNDLGIGQIGDRVWHPLSLNRIVAVGNHVYVQHDNNNALNIFGPVGPGRLGSFLGQVEGGGGNAFSQYVNQDTQIMSGFYYSPLTSLIFNYQVSNSRQPFPVTRLVVNNSCSMVATGHNYVATATVPNFFGSVDQKRVVIYRIGDTFDQIDVLVPPRETIEGLTFIGPHLLAQAEGRVYVWRQLAPNAYVADPSRILLDYEDIQGIQGRGDRLYVQRRGELLIFSWPPTERLPQLTARLPLAS